MQRNILMKITIPYKPRKWANDLHSTVRRWIVLVLHRRAGKTTAVLNHLQRDCLRIKESQFAYIGPTYTQSRMVAWEIAKKISKDIPGVKTTEQPMVIRYPNGSKLILVGSDNPDSLRGLALWGVGFDEYSQQPSNIFTEIISKALADHLGYAIFFGTPQGKNEFHRLYKAGLKRSDKWAVVLRTIDDSLRDEEGETIQNLRQALEDDKDLVAQGVMLQEEFDQEWYCSFEAAIKGAYYAKQIAEARRSNRIRQVPYDPAIPVYTVTDLGVGTALATGFYQKVAKEVHMIDYWQGIEKEGMPEWAKAIKDKPYVYGKHFAPHDIRATEMGTGKSRIETAKALGITLEIVPSMPVDDGINAGRLMFARLWINAPEDIIEEDLAKRKTGCAYWLDAISQYKQEWDQKKGMFREIPKHDWTSHPADVHRYASIVEHMMTNEVVIPQVIPKHQPTSPYEGTIPLHPSDDDITEQDLAKM